MMQESCFCSRCARIYNCLGQDRFNCMAPTVECPAHLTHLEKNCRYIAMRQYCPSCRAGLNKAMQEKELCFGRTKEMWKRRKTCFRYTIPIIALPLVFMLTMVYSSNLDWHYLGGSMPNKKLPVFKHLQTSAKAGSNSLNQIQENVDVVERDVQTNFVPPLVNNKHSLNTGLSKNHRKKREVSFEDYDQDVDTEHKPEMVNYVVNCLAHDYPDDEQQNTNADNDIYTDVDLSQDDFPLEEPIMNSPWVEDVENDHELELPGKEDEVFNLDNDVDSQCGDPNFRPFWYDHGDKEAIRAAQAHMMLEYIDTTVDPCNDFYQYACGNWEKLNPIPKDKGGYDTFERLRESLDNGLRDLLEEPMEHPMSALSANEAIAKAKFLYESCMNYKVLNLRGITPLMVLLDKLGGWPLLTPTWKVDRFDWLTLAAELRLYNNDIFISEWVGPDIRNSDEYVIQLDQSSLGLPTRDYFVNPSNVLYLQAYRHYMVRVVALLGVPMNVATINAEELIDFEIQLANITIASDERRNVSELYRRLTVGQLRRQIPQIDWYRYLNIVLNRNVLVDESVVVFGMKFFQDLINLLSVTPQRIICNYMLWRFVRHRVNNLDDRFLGAKQDFYFTLFGREQAPARWKNCVSQVNNNMGMAVGSMFVMKYFDEHSKKDTLKMTEAIMQSFRELLRVNDWIDPDTKRLANLKLDAILLRIGYPDFILNVDQLNERYADIEIRPEQYFENTLNILRHLSRAEQERLGGPVNKTLWNTAPAVVNAYYSRNKNQIMFPAGILQPPFYHRFFPRSLNFGGIGVVIGHEITHGFDDKGRLFDRHGNLHRWWADSSIEGFHERAQCLIDQYSHYVIKDVNMEIDGVNTQGENIADNGGIKQAFRAYSDWLKNNEDEDETLPGINATREELFFINFAQVWCGSMRPEATRNKLKTAVHAPGKFRVIGALSNSKDFARVFSCKPGSPMNPKNKCSVW